MPAKKLGAVVLTAVVVAGSALAVKNISFVDPRETVYKIADGDTFILEQNKQTVRLFGIDAPESGNCYGPQSYARLTQLLIKKKVQLKEPLVDRFGRIVALVYVDGKLINEAMIRQARAGRRIGVHLELDGEHLISAQRQLQRFLS